MIWAAGRPEEMDGEFGRHFFYFGCPLEANQARRIETLYLFSGPGDWRAVQNAWRRLTGAGPDPVTRPVAAEARAGSYLELGLEPAPLVTFGPEAEARLRLTSPRKFTLAGTVDLVPPDGWTVEPDRVEYQVDREHPVDVPVRLAVNGAARAGAFSGELRLRSQAFERTAGFDVIRLGDPDGVVAVTAGTESGFETWEIDNGSARWTVAPGFHGGVTAWRTGESDVNHLFSPFPDAGELSWMKPIYGGIRPVLHEDGMEGWPGKLQDETFSAEPVETVDGRGLAWRGVRLEAGIRSAKHRGLQVVLDYLTLPGSNVLKCVYRISNPTPVYRPAQHGWLVFPRVDGDMGTGILHTPDYVRQRTPFTTWGIHDTWAAVENPETGRALATVHANGNRRLLAMDLGDQGAHMFVREIVSVPPDGSVERIAYLALADTAAQARAYAALAELK
jgi:hypothetical protein